MKNIDKPYKPINCAFHDYLEHFATLRQAVDILYIDENTSETIIIKQAVIVDLTGGRNGEYLHAKTASGKVIIRNDYLISVGAVKALDFDSDKCGFKLSKVIDNSCS